MKKIEVILCLLLMSVATAFAGDLSPVQEKIGHVIWPIFLSIEKTKKFSMIKKNL